MKYFKSYGTIAFIYLCRHKASCSEPFSDCLFIAIIVTTHKIQSCYICESDPSPVTCPEPFLFIFQDELESLRSRFDRMEKERAELKIANERLESRVSQNPG